jgi:hypothetical protein
MAVLSDTRAFKLSAYAENAPDGAYDAVMSELRQLEREYELDPLEWLRETPVWKALDARVTRFTLATLDARNIFKKLMKVAR